MWMVLLFFAFGLLLWLMLAPQVSRVWIHRIYDHIFKSRYAPYLESVRVALSTDSKAEIEQQALELAIRGRALISPLDDRVPFGDKCTLRTAEGTLEDFVNVCISNADLARIGWYHKKVLKVAETAERIGACDECHTRQVRQKFIEWAHDLRAWANATTIRVAPTLADEHERSEHTKEEGVKARTLD